MRILIAGAGGVIGRALIPLLCAHGHEVFGTSRRSERLRAIGALGANSLPMDALDAESVQDAVTLAAPNVVIHQLTDLAGRDFDANTRLRTVGTRHLVDAARAAGVTKMVAQSISWVYEPGTTPAVEDEALAHDTTPGVADLERTVGEMETGVVLRYGLLYGLGTWYSVDGLRADEARRGDLTSPHDLVSFVHVDDAARAAVEAIDWPAGAVNIVDDEPARAAEWMPAFARSVGAREPRIVITGGEGRPVSNERAHDFGWRPSHPSWRFGFDR